MRIAVEANKELKPIPPGDYTLELVRITPWNDVYTITDSGEYQGREVFLPRNHRPISVRIGEHSEDSI